MFDILTTSHSNPEWIHSLLVSLSKTLHKKNRRIYICDGSSPEKLEQLRSLPDFGLDISIIEMKGEQKHVLALQHGLSFINGRMVCICDADVVFVLKHWDQYIEEKIKAGCDFVGISPRAQGKFAEAAFMVGITDIIRESRFDHAEAISAENWDESIMKRPYRDEHAYLTYLHHKYKKEFTLFWKCWNGKQPSRWGCLVYDNQDREFLYHNYYSSRHQPDSTGPAPEIEYRQAKTLIDNCAQNPEKFCEYFEMEWPNPLLPFLKANDG